MSREPLGLSYRLPRTEFTGQVTRHHVVRSEPTGGHALRAAVEVRGEPTTVADPSHPQQLVIDLG